MGVQHLFLASHYFILVDLEQVEGYIVSGRLDGIGEILDFKGKLGDLHPLQWQAKSRSQNQKVENLVIFGELLVFFYEVKNELVAELDFRRIGWVWFSLELKQNWHKIDELDWSLLVDVNLASLDGHQVVTYITVDQQTAGFAEYVIDHVFVFGSE